MFPLIMAALAGSSGALFGLSYKLKERRGLPTEPVLLLFGLLYAAVSLSLLAVFGEPLFSVPALWLGVLFGVSMYAAVRVFYGLIAGSQLNISWLILQFSIVFPFALSMLIYRERLQLPGAVGVGLMLASILFFGLGKRRAGSRPAVPDRRSVLLLTLSTALTGIAISIPRVYAATDPGGGTFTLLLYQGLTVSALAAVVYLARGPARPGTAARRSAAGSASPPPGRAGPHPERAESHGGSRRSWIGMLPLTLYMGLTNSLSAAFLVVATKALPGAIVYPVRSVMNVLVVFVMSFLLFRERVRPLEAVGSLVALAGIVLVATTLG
jgi:multidrug transporter EmrE-like cation transporter